MRNPINTASLSKLGFVKFPTILTALQGVGESSSAVSVRIGDARTRHGCKITGIDAKQRILVLENLKLSMIQPREKLTLHLEGHTSLSFTAQVVGPLVEGQDDVLMVKVPYFSLNLLRKELNWPYLELGEGRNPASH